jgi:hypothetical protein
VPPLPVPPPQPEGNLPDWLRDTQRSAGSADNAEQIPSWLADPDETTSDANSPSDDAPSWLSGLDTSRPAAAEPSAAPDWLSGANDTSPPAPATPPSWLGNTNDPPQPTSGEASIPDWLRDESTPSEPKSSTVPDWLKDTSDAGQTDRSDAESIDLWAPEPSATAKQPDSAGSADAGVPDWLRDISAEATDESDITAEPFSFEGASTNRGQEPSGPPAWLSTEDSSEAVPDWLRSAVDQSKDLAGTAPEAPAVPLWLEDAQRQPEESAAPKQPETSQPPAPAAETESLPPWLQSDSAQPADTSAWQPPANNDVPAWLHEPTPPTQPPPADNDVPAWLHEPTPPTQPQPAADNVPDWLRESAPTEPPPAADIPSWLQQESSSADTTSTPLRPAHDDDTLPGIMRVDLPVPPAPTQPPANDLPDWLRPSTSPGAASGQDLPPWLRDESGQPLPTAGSPGDTKLPAWLRGASTEMPPAAPPSQPPDEPANFDWLDQAAQADSQRAGSESEFFGSTELPAWLRPPEQEQPKEINQADARSLDWLTRLGGTDEPDVAVSPTVAAPKLAPLVARPRSAAQIEALALLERLAAAPFSEPAPLPAPAQPNVLRRVGIERMLYLALLIALIVGLIVPVSDSFGLAAPPVAPGAPELSAQIDKLSENDIVLVGYEWDARRSSELRPLEDAVLGQLIQRKVKLVLVSTDPQGTLLLFDFRDQLEKAGYRKGGEDYILLGYKPGAELALRSFAQDFGSALRSDFQGNDATISALATGADPSKPRLTSLSDFSMIMVLADEAQDVQAWMEQVHRDARQVPFAFLLPNETTPVAQPYLSQPGIFHLAGKQGALAYQSLRGESGMPAAQIAREITQQRLSMLVFTVLLLVGALIVGISTAARSRSTP